MSLKRLFFRTVFFRITAALIGFWITTVTTRIDSSYRAIYNDVTVNSSIYTSTFGGYGVFQNRAINRLGVPVNIIFPLTMVFWLVCTVVTLIVALIITPSGWYTTPFSHIAWLFTLIGSPLALSFGLTSRLLNALNKITLLNKANMVQGVTLAVIATAAMLLMPHGTVVQKVQQVLALCVAWVISQLFSAIIGIVYVLRACDTTLSPRWDRELGKTFLSFGTKIAIGNLVEKLNYRCDYYLVLLLLPQATRGIYGLAVAASELMSFLTGTLSTLVFSRMASSDAIIAQRTTELTFRFMLVGTLVSAAFAIVAYPLLVHVAFHPQYAASIAPFRVLVVGMIFLGPAELLLNYFTNQIGSPRISIQLELLSAVVNIAIGWILIHRYHILGAAIGSSAGYFLEWCFTVFLYGKLGRKNQLFRFSLQDFRLAFSRR